jgi:hypothetical protein
LARFDSSHGIDPKMLASWIANLPNWELDSDDLRDNEVGSPIGSRST